MAADRWTSKTLLGALSVAFLLWVPMVVGEYGAWSLFTALFWAGLFHLAALGVGERILSLCKLPMSESERWIFSAPLGWGVLGQFLFIAAQTNFYNKTVAWILVVVGLLLFGTRLKSIYALLVETFSKEESVPSFFRSPWSSITLTFISVVAFFSTLPPTFFDALVYHVGLPMQFAAHGGAVTSAHNMFSAMPLLGEMASSIPFLLSGDVAVFGAAYFWLFISFIAAIYATAERCLAKKSGAIAAAVFSSMPLVAFFPMAQKPDLLVGFFTLSFLFCLSFLLAPLKEASLEREDASHALVSTSLSILLGLFLGFGAATKTTFLPTGALLVGLLFALPQTRIYFREKKERSFLMLFTAFVVGSAVYLKNMIVLGNPVYPFAHALFTGPDWLSQSAEKLSNEAVRIRSWGNLLQLWRIFIDRSLINSPTVNELPGGFLWMAAVFLLGFRNWPTALKGGLWAAGLSLPAWLLTHSLLRYNSVLWVVLPLMSAWVFFKMQVLLKAKRFFFVFPVVLLVGAQLFWSVTSAQLLLRRPVDLLSGVSRSAHLAAIFEPYVAYQWLNKNTAKEDLIFLAIADGRVAYLERPAVFSEVYMRPKIDEIVVNSINAKEIIDRISVTNAQFLVVASSLEEKLKHAGWGQWSQKQSWQWQVALQGLGAPVAELKGYRIFKVPVSMGVK